MTGRYLISSERPYPMTTVSHESEDVATHLFDPSYDGPVKITGRLRRLLWSFVPVNLAIQVVYGAVPGLLLAVQVATIDEANKVGSLALITAVGGVVAMITQPIGGLLSDRTRSRFGRRSPWILLGTLVGGPALLLMGFQHSVSGLLVCWVIAQFGYSLTVAPMTAILPDRVPRRARGSFSTAIGIGIMVGLLGGTLVGAEIAAWIEGGYMLLAAIPIAVVVLFIALNPDRTSVELHAKPYRLKDVLRTFWVNPRTSPDFFWAFTTRFVFNMGFSMVGSYTLYLLSDFARLGTTAATAMMPIISMAGLVPLLIALGICGPLSDRLNRRKIFAVIASVILSLAVGVPFLVPNLTGLIIMAVGSGLAFGVFSSIDPALVSEVLPSTESFGQDIGVVNIAVSLPNALAPAIAGGVVLLYGYSTLFPVAAFVSILGCFTVLWIKRVR